MPDKTSIPTTNAASLGDDTTGIYAPERPLHATPRQRYGWRAALVLLVHALVLATILLSFDFLPGIPTASSPETLDMIVVDLSGTNEAAESKQSVTEPTDTSSSETNPALTQTPNNLSQELSTAPVEPIRESESSQPMLQVQRTAPAAPPPPPSPSTPPRVSPTAKVAPTLTANTNAPAQAASVASKDAAIQITSPRLDPAYLHNPAPNYPALSKRNRETGTVMLLVKVNPDGSVDTVSLHNTSGYDRLDQAAMQAVARWRFVPGRRGDEAISASVIVPISFKQP